MTSIYYQTNPCKGVACADPDCRTCVDGECVLREGAECSYFDKCPEGTFCHFCTCVECAGTVECPDGETCVDGKCVPESGLDRRLLAGVALAGIGAVYYTGIGRGGR